MNRVISPRAGIFISCVLTSVNSQAVVQIDNGFDVNEGHTGAVSFDIKQKSGATDSDEYELGARYRYRTGDNIVLAFVEKNYGKTDGVKSSDDDFLHLRYMRSEFVGPYNTEVFVQHESDEFKALAARNLAGVGISVVSDKKVVNTGELQFYGLVGVMREKEEHITDASLDELATRMTSTVRVNYQLPSNTKFYAAVYYQPKLSQFSDFRAVANTGFEVPLIDHLNVGFSYQYQYDSEPFNGVPKSNKLLSSYINYQF